MYEQDNRFFNEDDEVSDDEYFGKYDKLEETEENNIEEKDDLYESESDEDTDEEEKISSDHDPDKLFGDEIEVDYFEDDKQNKPLIETSGKYKVKSFSPSFLRCECDIKIENFKTVCKFSYQGNIYTGKVLKKLNADEYIFDVNKVISKSDKTSKPESGLKKIYIPDASLISAKTNF